MSSLDALDAQSQAQIQAYIQQAVRSDGTERISEQQASQLAVLNTASYESAGPNRSLPGPVRCPR
ncbi:hypothetical protein E4U58_001611 [Claviceps cyperi]|nr:hypothetical protein E4U58_001611 [Claviceps cyperi]